jgi:nucleotide-binding universal stress UspA family protein
VSDSSSDAIVFAVDFSEMTDFVVAAALELAGGREHPELHGICVLDPRGTVLSEPRQTWGDELAELEETLEARVSAAFESAGHPLDALGDWEFEAHARVGHPATAIAELAREVRASVIVVGRHGHSGPRDLLVGSVPTRLLQLARCDVMVVQPSDYPETDDG